MARGQLVGQRAAPPSVLEKMVLAQEVPVTLGSVAVGSTITLNVDGAPREWIVVHHGKPSSIYSSTFTGGTVLMMKDIYENRQWHSSNVNDYANSTIHAYLNNTFLAKLDADVRLAVKQVKIPYRPGSGNGSTINSGENGLAAKVWLPSGYELGWTSSDDSYLRADGAKYDFFGAGKSSDANGKRIGYLSGSVTHWWSRSPRADGVSYAYRVTERGEIGQNPCASSAGIRPCLVLPDSFVLSEPVILTDRQGEPLSILAAQVDNVAQIATGSYIGTGKCGRHYPNSLSFPFKPKLVLVADSIMYTTEGEIMIWMGQEGGDLNFVLVGNTLSWYFDNTYVENARSQYNTEGGRYRYVALG